jgi:hypothetical protein
MVTNVPARRFGTWPGILVLAAIAALARLPQLLSPNLLAEGDECLVGLMGLHVARGHDFPLFFYGQKYGLAVVEASAAAIGFALFGAGAVALKGAILAVWIAGAALYFHAFARVLGTSRSFLLTLLVVLMPAWAATSMKAWSGYVTAFAATGLVIDLAVRAERGRVAPWLAAGAATALVYAAQPLWLPGLVPIVAYHLARARSARAWTAYVTAVAVPLAVFMAVTRALLRGAPEVWFGPTVGNPHPFASWPSLVQQIYVTLTGSFYFAHAVPPGRVTSLVALLWFVVLCATLARQMWRLLTRRHLAWPYLLAASVACTIGANWLLLDERDARYMMAMNVPLVFLAGIELFGLADRFHVTARRCAAAIALLAIVQAAAMREFRDYTFMWWVNNPNRPSEAKTLATVIGYLQSRGITRVYSENALLQWTIPFYSGEAVVARWKGARDRYPPYIAAVDRAVEAGRAVAIVGYTGYTYGLEKLVPDTRDIVDIDGKYYVYVAPDRDLLVRAGFQLTR